jgi:hypothetical protein
MNQCKATAKGSGERCRRAPIAGGSVCRVHGGAAPQVKAKAERERAARAVTADAMAVLALEGLEPVESPLDALAALAAESLAMKTALAARVNALDSMTNTSGQGVESVKVEVALYERALDRGARFLDMLTRAGFEERRTALEEAQALMVARVLANTVNKLELDPERKALALQVVQSELRALDSSPAPIRGELAS